MVQEATFGAGCFWCVESCFSELKGVITVKPGYSGGTIKNPCYREVCSGRTKHVEVVRIEYDSTIVSFEELLEVFWFVHDPTTLNRQGNDIGEQYRSVIFYHNESQKELASKYKDQLKEEKVWDHPIVTAIEPLTSFYFAEEEHHNYYKNNPDTPYCFAVVRPKYEKFKAVFKNRLKDS